LNRWLKPFDLGLYRPSVVEPSAQAAAEERGTALPEGAEAILVASNPEISALQKRYAGHPAANHSAWSDLRLAEQIALRWFRGESQYLYQTRGTTEASYALAAQYVEHHGRLQLLDRLVEDGAFGANTFAIDGRIISRDLLDSILEIEALADWLGTDRLAKSRILDIGAGYGRLAHRLCEAFSDLSVVATDAVPVSTFLCGYYLGFRACDRSQVVPLDVSEAAMGEGGFDVATNVHSFGEAPLASVRWWLERCEAGGVPRLLLVHGSEELYALESDLSRTPLDPLLERTGYRCVERRPKYAQSEATQRLGVFPAWYYFYELR
jgi:putative sugar O-methyltransferase